MITDAINQLKKEGWVLLEGIIPSKEILKIRKEVEEGVLLDKNVENNRSKKLSGVYYSPSILNHTVTFTKYLAQDKIKKIMGELLGEPFRISLCMGSLLKQLVKETHGM